MVRRLSTFILALLLVVPVAAPAALAGPGEGDMLAKINAARASEGLPALSSHGTLVSHARAHSKEMADANSIFHTSNATLKSLVSGWQKIGENVGRGPNVSTLHAAFMASSGHRANIMGDFTHAGVGTYVTDDGMMYVTVVFLKLGSSTTTTTSTTVPPTTTTTVAPPATHTPTPTTVPAPTPVQQVAPSSSTTSTTTTTTLPPDPEVREVSWEQIRKHLPEMGIPDMRPCIR